VPALRLWEAGSPFSQRQREAVTKGKGCRETLGPYVGGDQTVELTAETGVECSGSIALKPLRVKRQAVHGRIHILELLGFVGRLDSSRKSFDLAVSRGFASRDRSRSPPSFLLRDEFSNPQFVRGGGPSMEIQ
jgi:hypothetical protein